MASKHPEMEHRTGAVNQSARDNPLTGSALQALVRGWIAGTAGMPGDLEGLGRSGLNLLGANVDKYPALPASDFYKEWLPGKQVGDENVTEVGSLFGGVGATKPVSLAKGALTRVAAAAPGPLAGSRAAMKGVIKAPGGNWLSGSVEDALKGLKKPALGNTSLAGPVQPSSDSLVNRFIDKQLTRYVKNDMATERDPIRALAERGTLHVAPEQLNFNIGTHGKFLEPGQTAVGRALPAKSWEGASDLKVFNNKAGDFVTDAARGSNPRPSMTMQANPWLQKVAPDAKVHAIAEPRNLPNDLGFDHLIDELRNATNPNSGLPANLLLKPESLDRVSVPQAVEHVAKINAWREAQKVEANQAIANNAATVLHKEYADAATNPKGLRWVELKKGNLPEGWVEKNDPLGTPNIYDQTGQHFTQAGTYKDPSFAALKDALKYEGDTMGHCVGGYCDDVASGKSRIFSLRDAKGQPHVTIETKFGAGPEWAGEKNKEIIRLAEERGIQKYMAPGNEALWAEAERNLAERGIEQPKYIQQIKGKANKKPNDEYLPFVQDFVKSGKWSDVGDLQNSGLRKTSDAWNANELKKIQDAGIEVPSHATQAEIDAIGEQVWPGQWGQSQKPAYAAGGSVYTIGGPDGATYGTPDEQPAASTQTLTLEDFRKRISPNMLDAEGKFKAPVASVNYMLEGLTPEQAYSAAQAQTSPEIDGSAGRDAYQNAARAQMLEPSWRTGPNNGGGFLGGLGAAAQGMFDGVRTNPAIMAALTAGVGSAINPAISEGLQSAGMSANAAKTAAPMVLNAGKTVLSGGSLADAAKGAAVGYAGGEIGGAVKDTTGSDFMGNAARTLTQSALNGGSLSIDELAAQYASGKLTDLSGLPPQVASIVVNLARNRKTTPGAMVGALSQVARKAS